MKHFWICRNDDCEHGFLLDVTPPQEASGPRGERPTDPPTDWEIDPTECPMCGAGVDLADVIREMEDGE